MTLTLNIQTRSGGTWHLAKPITLTNGKLAYLRIKDSMIFEPWEVFGVLAVL